MGMHPASILAENWLRHERGGEAECPRDVFHHEPEGRDVVGSLEGVSVPEVDLVLPMGNLVVRRFHFESHPLEDIDDRAPGIFAEISRREIEVRADVVRDRRRLLIGSRLEHEELSFHSRIHGVAQLRRTADHFL